MKEECRIHTFAVKWLDIFQNQNTNYLEIVDGKWLFEVLLYKILCTVIKKQNLKKEETRNNDYGE